MIPKPKYESGFGTARFLRKYAIDKDVELCFISFGDRPSIKTPLEERFWCLWISRYKVYAQPEMERLRSCKKMLSLGKWFQFDEQGEWFFEFKKANIEPVYTTVQKLLVANN